LAGFDDEVITVVSMRSLWVRSMGLALCVFGNKGYPRREEEVIS